MSEFKTIKNFNLLPIEIPENVRNFIEVLESSPELICNINEYIYEEAYPSAVYTDFNIYVKGFGNVNVSISIDISNKNPEYTRIQFETKSQEDDDELIFDFGYNLEDYCNTLEDSKRFLNNNCFRVIKQAILDYME